MGRPGGLRDASDPGKRQLGLPSAAPVHVHPGQQRRPIAAQLVKRQRYGRRVVPPPLRARAETRRTPAEAPCPRAYWVLGDEYQDVQDICDRSTLPLIPSITT